MANFLTAVADGITSAARTAGKIAQDAAGYVGKTLSSAADDAASAATKASKTAGAGSGRVNAAAAEGTTKASAKGVTEEAASASAKDAKDALQKELSALNLKKFNGHTLTQADIERIKELREGLPAWEKPVQSTKHTLVQWAKENPLKAVALGVAGAGAVGGGAYLLHEALKPKDDHTTVDAPKDGESVEQKTTGVLGGSKTSSAGELAGQKTVSATATDPKDTHKYSIDFTDPKNLTAAKDGQVDSTMRVQVDENGSGFKIVAKDGSVVAKGDNTPPPSDSAEALSGPNVSSSLQELPSGASVGQASGVAGQGGAVQGGAAPSETTQGGLTPSTPVQSWTQQGAQAQGGAEQATTQDIPTGYTPAPVAPAPQRA